ncbi:hypothetical protein ACFWQL_10575 [Amycolatopsis thermoflava]|uniref:hypothetical protein n=1 Tax=Amycolatopsis TaxID=1813 RepID=UPI00041FA1FE|nr:hypothetical protein [Amycolatopsis thermoflava]
MGVELELHAGRPVRDGSSLVRGSYEHGEALARVLDGVRTGRLALVDPYGDTMFNEQEAEAALPQVAALLRDCADDSARAALTDLAGMLEACAATPGGYLWFMGD